MRSGLATVNEGSTVVFLSTAFLVFSDNLSCTDRLVASTHNKDFDSKEELDRSFGIEGELMHQLLKGFGSELVADQILD